MSVYPGVYSGAYRQWLSAPMRVGDLRLSVATKPGVFAHGGHDPAAAMLAEAVARLDPARVADHGADRVAAGATDVSGKPDRPRSVHLHAGNGLVPAVALLGGYQPIACDRSRPNVMACERTLGQTLAMCREENARRDADEAGTPEPWLVHHVAVPGTLVPDGSAALVTIRIPPDRLGVQLAIAEAFRMLAVGGCCLLAGANDEGAKPAARLLEAVFGNAALEAQHSGHRLLRAMKAAEHPRDAAIFELPWLDPERFHEVVLEADIPGRGVVPFTQFTRPGVFSWEHLDEATALLAELMNIRAGDRVLDLGCGAGGLGAVAACRSGARTVLVDADADAVRCAARTVRAIAAAIASGRAGVEVEVRASDVAEAVHGEVFDVVVTNPPFHVGKATDLAVPEAFIEEAWQALAPGGRLYLVANRTLPYERLIHARFGEVRTAHDGRRFKVLGAVRT